MKVYNFKFKISGTKSGMYLPAIMVASTLFIAFATAVISLSMSNVKIADLHNKKITSMAIAEAGINYYMWHLAHDNTDYCDGISCIGGPNYGPYIHDYMDQEGDTLGIYELYITPPSANSSVVTVKSVGKVNGKSPRRTIIATIGMPSFTKYTLLADGNQLTLGTDGKINGTVHVNNSGVYNLGEITGDASSTEVTYRHSTYGIQPGVAGPGIFGGQKLFPVPQVDFNQLDVDILNLRNKARDLGEGDYYNSSGSRGYHIVLKNSSYDLYRVSNYNSSGLDISGQNLIGNYAYPEDGVIFLEDNVWIDGQVNNQKFTIIAADPEAGSGQRKRIIVPNSIKFTNYDGSDKIGLITQTDILVTRNAPADLEIDAAMIARSGDIKINYYAGIIKNSLKIYGSMACRSSTWKYSSLGVVVSGFRNREISIDEHNVLSPPPKFPLTGTYSILSWREE